MRDAETILAIIRERGSRGLPLEDVYRQLYNPDLYLRAYGRIYRNDGAMTRGVTAETVDGMSLEKIQGIIELLRPERYRWTPVRRMYIEKKGSTKMRPLGIPTWSDKLLQEVIRSLLEAYLRAAVQRPLPRLPPRTRLPHRPDDDPTTWTGDDLVHRGGHLKVLRQPGPPSPAVDPPREDPRRPLPAADREPAQGGIPGGLEVRAHPQRHAARRDRQPDPLEYLP